MANEFASRDLQVSLTARPSLLTSLQHAIRERELVQEMESLRRERHRLALELDELTLAPPLCPYK